MTFWYEVYEDGECGSNIERTIAFCKYKYSAETLARYFPVSKIRVVEQKNTWEWKEVE